MRFPVMAALAAAMALAASEAAAQLKLPADADRFHLSNLRNYMLGDDGKSVSPFSSIQDDDSMSFQLNAEGYLMGAPFTQGCVKLWSTGEGRMHYNAKGGPHQFSGKCSNIGETDYEWKTSVSVAQGRIVLEGEARDTGPCLRGETSCKRPTEHVIERAVLRVQGKSCTIESYSKRETKTSGNPYLKNDKSVFVTFSTAKTRCTIE